ncbi:type IV pilus sensor protein PilS, partial [mine drainage metagenome]
MHELKLQAMGRLTASIAHEIRNPLSAIRHAMQLLREFPALGAEERRLNQIGPRSGRTPEPVIGNILTLSRPPSDP